jgi:uncharacterized protein
MRSVTPDTTVTPDTWLLLAAGVLSGTVGTAGGTASLISYPALLAAGLPPLTANVTNSVAFVACWPGSALASRPELRGEGPWLLRWAPVAAAGAVAGAALLLCTPAGAFELVVPFLVAFAALALLFQPWITAWQEKYRTARGWLLLPAGLFLVTVYDGYFGAGSGVMTVALLLLTVSQNVAHSNALKNMILGVTGVASAVAFVLFGPVRWAAAIPLAAGLLVGSAIGPSIARRVPGNVLRVVVGLAGLGLAVHLWLSGG